MRGLPVCGSCHVDMTCDKNEVEVDIGEGFVKSGDRYKCHECGATVIVGFGLPYEKTSFPEENDTAVDIAVEEDQERRR